MPDDRRHGPTGDAMQILQNALLLHPPIEKEKPAILSINPSIWGEQHRVINIGPLLGARRTMTGRSEEVVHGVAMAFQFAGWPLQRIAEEFRLNLKSPGSIDVALLGEDGRCLVAVEVKRNIGLNWRRRIKEAWEQLGNLASDVDWHCVTDGITFFLRSNTRGEQIELERPFSPESLMTGDFSSKPSGSGD